MIRFLALFVAVVAVLFGVELLHPVQVAVIEPWTSGLAQLSAWLMTGFDPDVVSHGRVLQSQATGSGVSIEAGCNGVEAAIILVAGMVAFPAPWRLRLLGIAVGLVAVQTANLLRVVSLYYLNLWNREWFDFAHLYLWQALIMLDVLVVWLLWMRSVARHTGAGLAPAQP
jgi:exosortase H (IPTLxxWG-CTERM-specific)